MRNEWVVCLCSRCKTKQYKEDGQKYDGQVVRKETRIKHEFVDLWGQGTGCRGKKSQGRLADTSGFAVRAWNTVKAGENKYLSGVRKYF